MAGVFEGKAKGGGLKAEGEPKERAARRADENESEKNVETSERRA